MSFPQQTTTAKEINGSDLASYKNIKAQIATENLNIDNWEGYLQTKWITNDYYD